MLNMKTLRVRLTALQSEELVHMAQVRRDTIEEDPESATTFETTESLNAIEAKLEAAKGKAQDFTEDELQWMDEEIMFIMEASKANWENGDKKEGGRYRSFVSLFDRIDREYRVDPNITSSQALATQKETLLLEKRLELEAKRQIKPENMEFFVQELTDAIRCTRGEDWAVDKNGNEHSVEVYEELEGVEAVIDMLKRWKVLPADYILHEVK